MAKKLAGTETDSTVVLKKLYEKRLAENAEIYKEVIKLQKESNYSKAMTELEEIIRANPEKTQSYVLKAQLLNNLGELAEAVAMYRKAIEMDPDFVDKKSPLFIGNSVMEFIPEARGKLNREKKLKPGDKTIKAALENIYYLQRRIAGGCE
jgi:Flp pilus assembly protein TadD